MHLDAMHQISLNAIQRLAIECHALDRSELSLGFSKTHDDRDDRTRNALREIFSEKLLMLAIALRTKFYQGTDPTSTASYLKYTGFLEVTRRGQAAAVDMTFKDICDKIVHAEEITREYDRGHADQGILTILKGTQQGGAPWTMGISVAAFCEAIFNWLRDQPAT